MAWVTGTSTDYIDLLTQLIQVATSSSLSSVDSIVAGGTGYTVGDVIDLVGGTSTHVAKLEVTAVSSGAITAVRIQEGGAYTVTPGDPVGVTGPGNDDATFNLTFASTGWTLRRETKEAVSAAVPGGSSGTGYSVNDKLTIVGGVGVGTAAVFNVDTIGGGGEVTSVSLDTAGDYEEVPANDAATTGGGGSGAVLTVTYQAKTTADKVVIMEGSGGGSDEIMIGIRTYNKTAGLNTARNWALAGMASYNASLDFDNQPGISPHSDAVGGGAIFPLKENDADPDIDFWMSVTSRRFVVIAKCRSATTTHYMSCYGGFLLPFGTAAEFPYPIYISGCSARDDTFHSDTAGNRINGITDVIQVTGKTGPAFFRKQTDSTWQVVVNSTGSDGGAPTRGAVNDYVVYPVGQSNTTLPPTADEIVAASNLDWDDVIPLIGVPGTASLNIVETPETGDDISVLVPATLQASFSTDLDVIGELEGVFWVSGDGATVKSSEDRMINGDVKYRVFQNGIKQEKFSMMAIRED